MARLALLQRGKSKTGLDPTQAEMGPVRGWRPLSFGQAQWEQIGVYGDAYLNQFPAYYNQPQLHSAVEFLSSRLYTPTISVLPTFMQTQRPTNLASGQRYGSALQSPTGPLSAKRMQSRLVQAQLRQSGASALNWAQNLQGG